MYADGYLSEDERADDNGSDVDVWDPAKLKSGLGHGAEPVLHSVVDQPTTSYLNVVLGAKAQGQPVVICRADGKLYCSPWEMSPICFWHGVLNLLF